jgi:NAD(P)-dependent dehydrogenase (short-subunit alcohol dehydrogenase family)
MSIKTLFDLSGKVALITGGTRGLGLQMAEALGEMGARIVISARKPAELAAAATHLRGQGIEVQTVVNDLGALDAQPWVSLVDAALEHFGTLDILVNNAGTVWGAPAEEHPAEAWHKVMNLNVNAMFFLSQEVARRVMIPQRSGKIINIASIAGIIANDPPSQVYTSAYITSKTAVIGQTRALAAEWGRYNLNVNAICPGYFPSKLAKGLDRVAEQIKANTPMQRIGGAEDLKGAAVFLASEASRHVTGHALPVDGGITIV